MYQKPIPYLVLQIGVGSSLVLTPLTRLIVGTSIGSTAALVPLTLAAIPFFARIAETSLLEVDKGLVEAAQAMGCNYWQIIFKVLIPEAFPSLVLGGTILIVSLLNSSAMAGAVGGGGLGNLAIQYGYQRFDVGVMFSTIATLIVLVQIIQLVGDRLAQQMRKK